MSTPLPHRAVFWSIVLGLGLLLTLLIMPAVEHVFSTTRQTIAMSELRQIGQASLLYAVDHEDHLPVATDVWDYARILADEVDTDAPSLWISKSDPAFKGAAAIPPSILVANTVRPRPLAPAFRALKPGVAVALGNLNARMPATTPIAWTRGLRPDGTWSPHSPHGTRGGHITFVGGNVQFFGNLTAGGGELARFDGGGRTANILEALPPGTRIGEYTPTPEEQTAWAATLEWREKMGPLPGSAPAIFLIVWWIPFVVISLTRLLKKQRGALVVLLWPVSFSTVLLAIMRGLWW